MSSRWLMCLLAACSNSSGSATSTIDGAAAGSGCALTADTTATSTVTNGCALLTRDTSSCASTRTGLSGFWLKFSCRVTLTESAGSVELVSDDQPDYDSNYFPTSSACYAAYSTKFPDPNTIAAQHIAMTVPMTPSGGSGAMALGAVGMALNGVAIFDNQAAPGDDIFDESGSFDECQGHPQNTGVYHYHSEPYAISSADDGFIGVMRDGNPIYGRYDPDGSVPDLDASGGHTSVTIDSPTTPVYHYHANLQISTNAGTSGEMVWFLTTGTYAATPGGCTGC